MFGGSSVLLLAGIVGLFFVSPVWAEESMLFSVSSLSEIEIGTFPVIYGSVVDSNGNPLSDVEIQANFPSRTIMATTDSAGQFSITYSVPAKAGEYTVTVYATKDKMYVDTQITYKVTEKQETTSNVSDESKLEDDTKTNTYDNSKYDLASRVILEKIEDQKEQSKKKEILSEEQQLIAEQREQTKAEIKEDLKSLEKQKEFYQPRNAFLRFLADVDNSLKNIFWNQFLFTEEKTENARIAKQNALEEGKSSMEATKIFQKEAAVSQSEIMEHNKEITIKYGNATGSVQEQFDENGKLPRD